MQPAQRRASLLACASGLLLAAGAAQAQAQPTPDRSVDEYRNAARRALHACTSDLPEARQAVRAGDNAHCIATAKSAVAEKFDAAVASTMDPALRAALQRHQAAFFVSLAGLAPLPGEVASGYRQRQTGLNCALSHAWTDVERSEGEEQVRTVKPRP